MTEKEIVNLYKYMRKRGEWEAIDLEITVYVDGDINHNISIWYNGFKDLDMFHSYSSNPLRNIDCFKKKKIGKLVGLKKPDIPIKKLREMLSLLKVKEGDRYLTVSITEEHKEELISAYKYEVGIHTKEDYVKLTRTDDFDELLKVLKEYNR